MRRISITRASPERALLALLRHEQGDADNRIARWVFNFNGGVGWHDGAEIPHSPYPYSLSITWQWGFLFADGSVGICRSHHLDQALATCGLQLITEGGE